MRARPAETYPIQLRDVWTARQSNKPAPEVGEGQHCECRGGGLEPRHYVPKYLVLRAYQYGL